MGCLNLIDLDMAGDAIERRIIRLMNYTPYDAVKSKLFLTSMEHVFGAYAAAPRQGLRPMLVEKKVFELPRYTTRGGALSEERPDRLESYGRLNRDRSNAILVTHYFSATSHAAGRYAADDALPGYWDAIIGPGKAIDTDKFFVLSSDTLVNLNARDPNVVTTGPASIDPETGRRYGMSFPVVSIDDFVALQKALVESLGITRLRAIAGASMGALQAYQWAVSHPGMVDRILPVIGAAGGDPFLIAWLDIWALPVRLDPKWRAGDYPEDDPPLAGMTAALKTVTLHANQSEWASTSAGRRRCPGATRPRRCRTGS